MDNRINFINMTMDCIHENVVNIYESLIDEEYDDCERYIEDLILVVKDLKTTFTEDL